MHICMHLIFTNKIRLNAFYDLHFRKILKIQFLKHHKDSKTRVTLRFYNTSIKNP